MKLKETSVLTDDEKLIIERKYVSKKFRELDETEKLFAVKNLLLKIAVITGWPLPNAELKNILINNFFKKISEEYFDLNIDEMEYAFRSKGTVIEDWGKEINLNLLDKVLRPYLENRFELSKIEERLLPVPERRSWTKEDILNQYRYEIETCFQALRKGYRPIIHIYFEDTLRDDGMLNEGENISEFFVRKLNSGAEHLYIKE